MPEDPPLGGAMTAKYYKCGDLRCGWIGSPGEMLRAPNPFEDGELQACPKCHGIDNLLACCDEPECFEIAICGIPTHNGYRRTCSKHMPEH